MARIAIVGVGAIGGVIAGLLETAAAHELLLCTRRPLAALTVETPEGIVTVRAANLTSPAEGTAVDWILVATKTYDSLAASAWFPALCGEQTRLAIIQNGVEHRENFAGLFPAERMLPVIIEVPAERRADGSILQRGSCTMRAGDSAAGHAFAALFAGTKASVELTADFLSAAWRKLCLNSAGVLSALTLTPNRIFQDEAIAAVALGIVAECLAVARAEGATLEPSLPEQVVAGYRAASPEGVNSLLADCMAHRPTEIDARNGVIVRLGETHGIPTPLNRMAVALIRATGA
jgi:2-dehydropantoate 2-reductase